MAAAQAVRPVALAGSAIFWAAVRAVRVAAGSAIFWVALWAALAAVLAVGLGEFSAVSWAAAVLAAVAWAASLAA
jgi:hypothetical protein